MVKIFIENHHDHHLNQFLLMKEFLKQQKCIHVLNEQLEWRFGWKNKFSNTKISEEQYRVKMFEKISKFSKCDFFCFNF